MDVRGAGGQELAEYYQPAWTLGIPEAHDYIALIKSDVIHSNTQ